MFGRALSALLSLAVSVSLFAASADLVTTVEAPAIVQPDETFTYRGTVRNLGPDDATQVRVELTDFTTHCMNTIDVLPSGQSRSFQCQSKIDTSSGYLVSLVVNANSAVPDPSPVDNWSSVFVRAITPPDLWVSAYVSSGISTPGLPVEITVGYANRALTTATGVTITIISPTGFLSVPDFCTAEGNRALCSIGTIEAFEPGSANPAHTAEFKVRTVASDESAGRLAVTSTIDAAENDARPEDNQHTLDVRNYRTFFVTTNADSGSGSLRAAFEGVNAECSDTLACLIAFRIPAGGQAWQTIDLVTPLPRLVHSVTIDGTTQALYVADSNAAGPEIEIRGGALREGNGIVATCPTEVRGLTLNGFPENGILTLDENPTSCTSYAARLIRDNYIGTDPTGTHAVPNRVGIGANSPGFSITGNIISGNTRSGVFAGRGLVNITRNRIGLDAQLAPLGNGASGVFIGKGASGSDVSNNYIGFNRDFGVAIAADATSVSAAGNSIQANGQRGIDWGLDGSLTVTPTPVPEITSVRFENGSTIIEGTSTAAGTFAPGITVYANDEPDPSGYGEGQYVLGEVRGEYVPGPSSLKFRFVSPTDLRGKWITATATRHMYYGWLRSPGAGSNGDTGWQYYTTTSEFSRAVKVE